VSVQDIDEYHEHYDSEVQDFVRNVSGDNPAVYKALALEYFTQMDCLYPYRAPYAYKKEKKKSKSSSKSSGGR